MITTSKVFLDMFSKIKIAFEHPEKLLSYFAMKLRSIFEVKKIYRNGKLFHRFKGELYPDYLNHGNASSFIKEKAQQFCRGKGIDVGAGDWPFPGAIPIKEEESLNAYKLDLFEDNFFDYVFSSHCLEHLEYWEKALVLWSSKIKYGGIIFLYLPHESMKLWNPGAPWVGYLHKWQPRYEILVPFLKGINLEIIEYNPLKDDYWSFHIVARKPVLLS